MTEKTFSEINEGWIKLCEEAKQAIYNRDILLFSAFYKETPNTEAMQTYEKAEVALKEIEERRSEYRKKYGF